MRLKISKKTGLARKADYAPKVAWDAWADVHDDVDEMLHHFTKEDPDPKAAAALKKMKDALLKGNNFLQQWLNQWPLVQRAMAEFKGEIGDPDFEKKFDVLSKFMKPYE